MRVNKEIVLNDLLRNSAPGTKFEVKNSWGEGYEYKGVVLNRWHFQNSKHVRLVHTLNRSYGYANHNSIFVFERLNTKIRAAPKHNKKNTIFAFSSTDLAQHTNSLPWKVRNKALKKLKAENPYYYMEFISVNSSTTLQLLKKYRKKTLGKKTYFPQKTALILGIGGWDLLEALLGLKWNGKQYEFDAEGSTEIVNKYFKPLGEYNEGI